MHINEDWTGLCCTKGILEVEALREREELYLHFLNSASQSTHLRMSIKETLQAERHLYVPIHVCGGPLHERLFIQSADLSSVSSLGEPEASQNICSASASGSV